MNSVPTTTKRSGYHHGDLKNALVSAAVDAALSGGPEAIVLGHVAKEVGVSAAAAYRHFPEGHSDLVIAVAHEGMLRMGNYLREGVDGVAKSRDPAKLALRRFRAAGHAYVRFAMENKGLFETSCVDITEGQDFLSHCGDAGVDDPFGILLSCLQELQDVGLLATKDRGHADYAAWSGVHGVAVLLTSGPFRNMPKDEQDALIERVLDMIGIGLTGRAQ